MPELQVSVVLPYILDLSEGDYQTAQEGEVLRVGAPVAVTPFDGPNTPFDDESLRTPIHARFNLEDGPNAEEIPTRRARCAEQLLRRINRLLRWYRAVTRRAEITEVTRAQVSPFRFESIGASIRAEWIAPLVYEGAGPKPTVLTLEQATHAVRAGLAGGNEPEVAALFLLDAERALHQGRFREIVLFSWSTIDSVFNRRYDSLVDAGLAGEWGEARDFFKGLDFKLRNKMSAGLHLFANRSLFREPGDFWQRLSASYNRRNVIIHRGENASEDEAMQAIDVARRIVQIMGEV